MSRKSKKNANRQFFTAAERDMLGYGYGTRTVRLGADAFLNYYDCAICLHAAVSPVACPEGHLYCKECIYNSLLSQKQNMKRAVDARAEQIALREQAQADEHSELAAARATAFRHRERAPIAPAIEGPSQHTDSGGAGVASAAAETGTREVTFVLRTHAGGSAASGVGLASAPAADRTGRDGGLSSNFWLASNAPDARSEPTAAAVAPVSTETQCPEGSHPLRLKQLFTVLFKSPALEAEGGEDAEHVSERVAGTGAGEAGRTGANASCWLCLSQLTNAQRCAVLRRCGHVLCSPCAGRFVKEEGACPLCRAVAGAGDVIALQGGGSAYAASNTTVAAKKSMAYRG